MRRIDEVHGWDGPREHAPGAVVLAVDGTEVLSTDLWDDVDWLWPLLARAFDACRRTGAGRTAFPDQPLRFSADVLPRRRDHVLLSVTDGTWRRSAVAPAAALWPVVARAGLDLFAHPAAAGAVEPGESVLRAWPATP